MTQNILVGKYFHSRNDEQIIEWQGEVVAYLDLGYYLVQLYEWWVGGAGVSKVVALRDMKTWDFYCCADDMRRAYESETVSKKGSK